MPYNVVEANRQATQSGVALGRAIADNTLRTQQLKSQQALQRLQEQQAAQRLKVEMESYNQMVDQKAKLEKANMQFRLSQQPTLNVPTGTGATMPTRNPAYNPDAGTAFINSYLPTASTPDQASRIVLDGATLKLRQNQEKALQETGSVEPEVRTVTDPQTGKPITLYRTGPNSWARRPDTLSEPRATSVNDPVSGNPVSMVQTGPNSFSRIPLSSGQQALEKTEIASGDIFEKGRRLLPLINDKTTGIRGGLQRALVDSRLGLLFPKMVDPKVSEADAVAREFAASIVHGLRSDGNINEKEWQGLTEEANTLKWVDERTGKARLKAFVQGAVVKARNASLRLGRPINEKYLTAEELGKRAEAKMEAGEMSREEALEWAAQAYQNSAEAFLRDIEQQIEK